LRQPADHTNSDILHPNRPNIAKEELREKLGALYKAQKDQISVFGLRTQFGGGKTTGFALVYDSPEAMKKFEPQYRLVRVGLATKRERASRQQRTYSPPTWSVFSCVTSHRCVNMC
jgi:small subunit ribosomal protein S24e